MSETIEAVDPLGVGEMGVKNLPAIYEALNTGSTRTAPTVTMGKARLKIWHVFVLW